MKTFVQELFDIVNVETFIGASVNLMKSLFIVTNTKAIMQKPFILSSLLCTQFFH